MFEISQKTKNTISIGNLRYIPFNNLQLDDVFASDLKNDTLFYAKKLNAGFDFFRLFQKKLVIYIVEADQFDLHITKDSINAPFNFQFLIDAFATDTVQPAESSKLQLAIDRILLKNGHIRYDVFSEPYQTSGLFDVNHIDLQNLQLNANLSFVSPEYWSATIDNFSFDEKGGFSLKQLKLNAGNILNRLRINDFYIALPHSEATFEEINLDYTGMQLNEILSGATYTMILSSGKVYPGDLNSLYPTLDNYTDYLTCSGRIEGQFPEITLPYWEMNYGTQLDLIIKAESADYTHWETSAMQLDLIKCRFDPELFKLPLQAEEISISGKINGSLPHLKFDLTAESMDGDLSLKGTGGYRVSSGNIHFDIELESPGYNINNLLPNNDFGNTSFRLTTQGTVTALNKIDAKADAEIRQFDYLGYSYRDINASITHANDSVSVDIISNDPQLPVVFQGKAGLNKNNSFAQFTARINGIKLDALNLLPKYPGSEISGNINGDIRGFDPELMTASVVIENLHWIVPKGEFNDSPITLAYIADANRQKQINLRSPKLNIRGKGNLTYQGMAQSFRQAFPGFFPPVSNRGKKIIPDQDHFDFTVGIRQANTLAKLLGMETTIPDSAFFIGKYYREKDDFNLNLNAFCVFTRSDTAQIQINLSNSENALAVQTVIRNRSNQYDLEGNIDAEIEFIPNSKTTKPDLYISLNPGYLTMNGTNFQIRPAQITIAKNRYEISNFALRHSRGEYVKLEGIISDNTTDSLMVTFNRFQIKTIMSAMKNNFPLSGVASGDIAFSQLKTTPLIFTRNFTVDSMVFDGNSIGNLQLRSAWSSERQGLALRALWSIPNKKESIISGFVLPNKDSLALTADVQGINLKWLNGYLPDTFYGLDGELSATIRGTGKMKDPDLSGTFYFNNATVGVPMLNTKYRITDSIFLEKNRLIFKDFLVHDETNRNVKINGNIVHDQFLNLNPRLTLDFNQFLVLNNSEHTDSLFYGLVRVNGNLSLQLQNRDWLLRGRLSNERGNKFMINLPETSLEAQRYNWITFVSPPVIDPTGVVKEQTTSELSAFSIPLRLQITLSVDPNLSVGAVIDPDTKDAAIVTGRGVLDFSYSLADPVPRLVGSYTIEDGKCTLSLKNITKKTFTVQPGGKLNFHGDIMNTTFDLSAIYSLRTYLTSLDPSFASIMTASRIPVNCILSANGKMEDMKLKYQIELPNQTDEIQRKLDGLIYSDDLKIMQIAYLLAFGSFLPANSGPMSADATLWTSLASSSITSQLNNLLSGILWENWTIGTDLHSKDANFSDVDMDVNISTRIFADRLTINSTFGYHSNPNEINNFTGDFNIEYKLLPTGNLLLQFYNVTNNQYYNRARSPLTQGVGIVYKRESRMFRQLFRTPGTRPTGVRNPEAKTQ